MQEGGYWVCQDPWELSGGAIAEGEVPGAKRTERRLRKLQADIARTICGDSQYALLKNKIADGIKMQNINCLMTNKTLIKQPDIRHKIPLSWETFVEANGYYWFTSDVYNGLFCFESLDLKRNDKSPINAKFIDIFPNEIHRERLWSWIEAYENYLIFVPLIADNFTIYNIENKEFLSIPVEQPNPLGFHKVKYNEKAKFSVCIKIKNKVIFLPYTYPAIAVLDLKTMTISYKEQPIREMSTYHGENGPYFWKNYIKIQENCNVCLWSPGASSFVSLNLRTMNVNLLKKLELPYIYFDVIEDGKYWWMIPLHGKDHILKIQKETNDIQELHLPAGVLASNYAFSDVQYYMDNIILFPRVCNSALVVDTRKSEIRKINSLDNFIEKYTDVSEWNFRFTKRIGENIYGFSSSKAQMVVMNLEKENVSAYEICFGSYSEDKIESVRNLYLQMEESWGTEIYTESEILSLDFFLKRFVIDE